MNVFSRQGRALPSKVRNQIIDKWLSNEDIASIGQQINLPYKTVSNIMDLWVRHIRLKRLVRMTL